MEGQKSQETSENQTQQKYKSYLVLHNVGKKKNVGTIIRSACAFNLSNVFLISKNIGGKKYKPEKDFNFFGNQNTAAQIDYTAFGSLKEAKEYFVQNNIFVCGVEIMHNAQSITKHPFKGNTAFILGNEGTGLNDNQKAICDHFVYIPQYTNKTASLNIAVAGSIIFHHFAMWAGFEETPIYSEKFQIQDEDEEKKGPSFQLKVQVHLNPIEKVGENENSEVKDVEDLDKLFE